MLLSQQFNFSGKIQHIKHEQTYLDVIREASSLEGFRSLVVQCVFCLSPLSLVQFGGKSKHDNDTRMETVITPVNILANIIIFLGKC